MSNACECGCGKVVRKRFAAGHNIRVVNPVEGMDREARRQRSMRHGQAGSEHGPEEATGAYRSWGNMLMRVRNTKHRWYGGRGISVCYRWLTFDNFYADMGDRPKGMEISRIDHDADYGPDNCVWKAKLDNLAERNERVKAG